MQPGCLRLGLSRMLRQHHQVDQSLWVVRVLLQSLTEGCLCLSILALSYESDCLPIQEQGCAPKLVNHLLVDIIGLLDFISSSGHVGPGLRQLSHRGVLISLLARSGLFSASRDWTFMAEHSRWSDGCNTLRADSGWSTWRQMVAATSSWT